MRVLLILCLLLGSARAGNPAESADDVRSVLGYRNGRPMRLKVTVVGGNWVEVKTARAFEAMARAAAVDGIELWIYSGFRDHERQKWLYRAWRAGWGNRAARPGHSHHQSGRALDLYVQDTATRDWLLANARRFGFRRTVSDEPWHFEYTPVKTRRAAKRSTTSR